MWIPIFLLCAAFFLAWAIGQALFPYTLGIKHRCGSLYFSLVASALRIIEGVLSQKILQWVYTLSIYSHF